MPAISYLCKEFVAEGDLVSFIAAFGLTKKVHTTFQQVVSTGQYLYKGNIWHSDIRPKNILIDVTGNTKLCDFGVAIRVTSVQTLEIYGAHCYCCGGQRLPQSLQWYVISQHYDSLHGPWMPTKHSTNPLWLASLQNIWSHQTPQFWQTLSPTLLLYIPHAGLPSASLLSAHGYVSVIAVCH